jgi:ribosomal protein S6
MVINLGQASFYYQSGQPVFIMENEEVMEGTGSVYELAYLFVPTIAEDAVIGTFGDLKAYLEKKGAIFIQEELPKMMQLAYEMSRTIENKKTWFETAYFGFIKFEMDPSAVESITPELSRNEDIIRFMIVKTVRENTIAGKRVHGTGTRKRAVREDGTPEVELSKEQIEAEIDALVSEEPAAVDGEVVVSEEATS